MADDSVYDADVDEMTAGQLAVLQEVRRRLEPDPRAVAVVDGYAAELAGEEVADTARRVAVVGRDIEGTDIRGYYVAVRPGRDEITDYDPSPTGVACLLLRPDGEAGRAQLVNVHTRDITVEAPPNPAVRRWASEYTVTAVPADHRWADDGNDHWRITVEYRGRYNGGEWWAVLDGRLCLGADGAWDYESIPSERTDEWLATHRFDRDTALRLAEQAAPDVSVNGVKARDLR